jgi:glycosyltransferase involved in cell wall biosynthesis
MTRPVRVLHLCSNAGPNPYFNALFDFRDRRRFHLTFASLGPTGVMQEELRRRGAATFAMDCQGPFDLAVAGLRLMTFLRQQRIDVLQTHLIEAAFIGGLAARAVGTPLVVFTGHHSHEVILKISERFRMVDTLVSRHISHRVIAHSKYMRDIFVEWEGVPPEQIAVIPYAFDFRRLIAPPDARARIRRELRVDDRIVFAAVGRLFWVKALPTLIRAFAGIRRREPRAVLLIAGEGVQRDELTSLIRELRQEDGIRLIGARSDIPAFMTAIDAFVHPSLTESFCQVVVEAFAARRPVVHSAVGIAPEIIADGVNGYLVPPGDEAALEAALGRMLDQRPRWDEMGAEGRKRVEPFAAEVIVPRFQEQYLRWLG